MLVFWHIQSIRYTAIMLFDSSLFAIQAHRRVFSSFKTCCISIPYTPLLMYEISLRYKKLWPQARVNKDTPDRTTVT